jgi:hypothetical protein
MSGEGAATHVDVAVPKRDEGLKCATEGSRRRRTLHSSRQVGQVEAGVGEEVSAGTGKREGGRVSMTTKLLQATDLAFRLPKPWSLPP